MELEKPLLQGNTFQIFKLLVDSADDGMIVAPGASMRALRGMVGWISIKNSYCQIVTDVPNFSHSNELIYTRPLYLYLAMDVPQRLH